MKQLIRGLFCLLLVCALIMPVLAAQDGPEITLQPQSPNYPEYSTAIYTVKATGNNLTATWYMEWQGKTYNLSDFTNGFEPWETYAGESYGPVQNDANTFSCFFGGIEEELNGAKIWCVIEDGHYDVTSSKATISITGSEDPPEIISFPAEVTVNRGDLVELCCQAKSTDGSQITWLWYETSTGNLQDIMAICDGPQYSDTWTVNSELVGTRYYVCAVQSDLGGIAYSNVVAVTVMDYDPEPEYPQETQKPSAPKPKDPVVTETEPETIPETEPETVPETVPETIPETVPETTVPVTETAPAPTEPEVVEKEVSTGLPWWGMLIVGIVAAGAGVLAAVLLMKKKS